MSEGRREANFLVGVDYTKKFGTALQSSFEDSSGYLFLDSNGFVHAATNAYNQHYHLKIRPEDIWLAVLTQLSSYINGHAEELRGSFIAFEGKQELKIEYDLASRKDVPWDQFASTMTHLPHQNVVDSELREWIMPAFSTTTEEDKVVASILMMPSLQKYFGFKCRVSCGLPSVTLLEPSEFAHLVAAVVKRFIKSFEDPKDAEVLDFWNRIVSAWHIGSGMDHYSGWLTAFMFWDSKGKPLRRGWVNERIDQLVLDGNTFPVVDMEDVPQGYCTVPIKIDEHGRELAAEMLAGSVGCHWTTSNETASVEQAQELVTVQPWSGWWIYEVADDRRHIDFLE